MLKELVIVYMSVTTLSAEEDICDSKFILNMIPGGLFRQSMSLLTTGGVRNNFGCHNYTNLPFTGRDLKYELYTRESYKNPITLTTDNLYRLDKSKPTKIVFPGWLCSVKTKPIVKLIHTYLSRYDCNVIAVDHRKFSLNYYYTASFCNIQKGGDLLGDFLCTLGLDFDKIHMVGHSIGAHLAGLAAQKTKSKCNQVIDRITGLDPAGPIYNSVDKYQRLDKSHARFVDIIHTSIGIHGYYGSLGHVDFYPDGGRFQSNCKESHKSTTLKDLLMLPAFLLSCSHGRSVDYFTDSIMGPKSMFLSRSCTLWPKHLPTGSCLKDEKRQYIIMGEDCNRNYSSATEFYWRSKKKYPIFYR